ncbi:alpha-hydroxy-acid oxidizing protein [Agrobacterium tumefaciens]|uniref:alpha-hydroxy-acid oxidizing protein n=1 Tax=Agrobacterium tumefaciens TaxID=358 RepID=UPI001E5B4EF8
MASKLTTPILVDSGRRGTDVVKALALGAKAALLGGATLYSLAARGEEGVQDVIRILREEIDSTIASSAARPARQYAKARAFYRFSKYGRQ